MLLRRLYFPVFMLGAVFGKVIELSGFSKSIVSSMIGLVGHGRAMLSIVLVCAIFTYGGMSLFVVAVAVYPFMSIALAAMSDQFIAAAKMAGIPPVVLHRVASMASGGMDTLPHNGAVITLLAVTGLTHRQSYGDIFAITCIKTMSVFVVIAVYYLTGIV